MAIKSEYKHGQFCWVDLVAHDMPVAEKFYSELFGWTTQSLSAEGGPPYAQFELNGNGVAGIGQMSDEMKSAGIPPTWNSYVNVDDVDGIVEKAKELGATITVPPMKVMEAGWLAFFMDPGGASIGLWKKGQHCGATFVNEPGGFCWNELATRDSEKARAFYDSLFGWSTEEHPGPPTTKYYLIKNQGEIGGGMIQMTAEWGEMPSHWVVYFNVSDIQATVAKLQELGGRLHHGPFDTEVGPIANVADPQGASFALIQLKNLPPE